MSMQSAVHRINRALCGALAGAALLAAGEAQADCPWKVAGKLKVNHKLAELDARDDGSLKNVEVRVSAKAKVLGGWGTWNAWPATRSGDDGSFSVSNSLGCGGRRFKIEVRFKDDELQVQHETSTSSLTKVKWYTILDESGGEHAAGTTDFGTFTFNAGGAEDLNDDEAWSHADIWYLYKKAIAEAASYGSEYAFANQVEVKYPHNSDIISDAAEASYCNPTTQVIYIFRSNDRTRDHFDLDTLLHELGHKWAYNHSSGETCLTVELVTEQNTHGLVTKSCVAFHEGWAEFFANEMRRALFGGDKLLPYGRPFLNNNLGLSSVDLMQRHDGGWWSIFHTLTTSKLHKYDFGTATSGTPASAITPVARIFIDCDSPDLTFKNVMTAFNSSETYTKDISAVEMTIEAFLERAAARLGDLSASQGETIEELVDPSSTVQPASQLCR